MTDDIIQETTGERLDIVRYVMKHVFYCADDGTDGELLAMVRYQRDAKDSAQARVRKLENILRRHGIDENDPLPPVCD